MFGLFAVASMRISLGMAITCMVNSTAFVRPSEVRISEISSNFTAEYPKCYRPVDASEAKRDGYGGHLLWSPSMQGLLFSASFWGGLMTTVFSGYLADRFGPKMIVMFAVIDMSIMSALGPFLAEQTYWAYFGTRVVLGMGEGFVIPCLNSLAVRWFPPNEKSTLGAIYTTGNQIAASLTSVLVAVLCTSPLGWPAIFYIHGIYGIIWSIIWKVFVSNTPSKNKWISKDEEEFIERKLATKKQSMTFNQNKVPWRKLVFGKVPGAVYGCQFAFNFSITLLQAFLPTYLKDHLLLPIHLNGIYTMIPFVAQFVLKIPLAMLSDFLKQRNLVDSNKAVKIFQGIGSFGIALSILALATIPSCERPYLALPILTAIGLSFSCAIPGFFTSTLSIAPPYTGTMSSIGRAYSTFANIFGSLLVSLIEYMNWPHKWIIIFSLASLLHVLSGVNFVLNGQAKVQSWVYRSSDEKGSIEKDIPDITKWEKGQSA
ncbi:unnamed protein product, partial [Mesorhabditis belari]|uniref:Major facilitator superfamily (MFS) profile domain-containing protein n=1 Tax=Mesorhabditis belari TaxID=2138241 RepID=A0AAF3F658_9BILA